MHLVHVLSVSFLSYDHFQFFLCLSVLTQLKSQGVESFSKVSLGCMCSNTSDVTTFMLILCCQFCRVCFFIHSFIYLWRLNFIFYTELTQHYGSPQTIAIFSRTNTGIALRASIARLTWTWRKVCKRSI